MRRFPILLLFFISSGAALIYQVAWVRQATLVFGVSVYAYSIVLAAFMGGLALGSYALRRYADRVAAPLRLYSLLQLLIAAAGLLSPFLLTGLMPLYGRTAQLLPAGFGLVTGLRAILSALVLIPPAFLMGATLPIMARALARRTNRVGSDMGQLYAADTLGAALATALTGLFLLRTLGTRETVMLAAGLNLLAALGAWLLNHTLPVHTRHGLPTHEIPSRASQSDPARYLVAAYGLSGFAALGYEIAWARILAIFTLDAVFSFSIMLATLLTGFMAGSWIGAWWMRRRPAKPCDFGLLQVAVALSAILSLFIFARLPALSVEQIFGAYSVTNVILYEFLLGFVTIFTPSIFLGLLFPVVVSLYTAELIEQIGERAGLLNAVNTAGAIAGSLIAGFVLIPLLGLQTTILVLAALNLSIGAATFYLHRPTLPHWWRAPLAGLSAAALLLLFLPSGYYLGFREGPSDYLVYYAEGVETTVAVFDVPDQNFKVSFVNGRIEVPTDDVSMRAFRLLGHLPPIIKPDAQRALMLSFGNGIATGSLDTHSVPDIDAVDLSAEQFKAAEIYWQENHNVLHSPRLHTHVEDGRNFLLQTPHQYDIITTDATHPTNTSSWALFTREFYTTVAARLTPDGIFLQWVPFHSLQEDDYKTILRTFQSVFPHATLWYTGGSHSLLLATADALTAPILQTHLQAAAGNTIVRDDLGPAPALAVFLAMDHAQLRLYTGDGALVTDNNAYFLPHDGDTEKIMAAIQQAHARSQ